MYASKSPVLMLSISCSVIFMISWRRAAIVNTLSISLKRGIGTPDRSINDPGSYRHIVRHNSHMHESLSTSTSYAKDFSYTDHPLESSQNERSSITFAEHLTAIKQCLYTSQTYGLLNNLLDSIGLQWHDPPMVSFFWLLNKANYHQRFVTYDEKYLL